MAKQIKAHGVRITDVGNINIINKSWFSIDHLKYKDGELKVDDLCFITVYEDSNIPGGVYSHIVKADKSYANVLGDVLQCRTDECYVMKNDKARIQYEVMK